MKGLYGRYEKSLDSKNRLIVPNALRKKLKGEGLILVGWFDRCLALFPASRFEEIAEKIGQLQVFSEEVRGMRRQLFGSAFSVDFDNQGRISLPDYLLRLSFMNGSREVILIGDYDKVEIWPRSRFEEFDEKYRVNLNNDYEQTLSRVAELALSQAPGGPDRRKPVGEASGEEGGTIR